MILLVILLMLTIAILTLPNWLVSIRELPTGSGKWQVGTTNLTWDATDRSGTRIVAKIWYPTDDRDNGNSSYIDRFGKGLTNSLPLNIVYKLIFWLLRHVSSPASIDATPIHHRDGLPIILFSPGFGGINYLYTVYALEFASHGFMTIGINHPLCNVGTMCTDGSQIKFEYFDPKIFSEPRQFEQYLGNINRSQSQNISTIIDKIILLDSQPSSLFYQRIDSSRIFAAGHSVGGAASFVACGHDRRILKAVNLDGAFIDLDIGDADYTGKNLLLINSDRDKYKPKNQKSLSQYEAIVSLEQLWMDKLDLKASLQKRIIESVTHIGFGDLSILINPKIGRKIGLLGSVDGATILQETSTLTIDFFNKPGEY
jgi:dienelactone hydrolase